MSAALNTRRCIIEAMGAKPMALDDIADRAGYTPETVHRHLQAMSRIGLVAKASIAGLPNAGWIVGERCESASPVIAWLEERGLWAVAKDAAMGAHATLEEVCTRSQLRRMSRARQAVWSALEMKGLSRSEIARVFNRDQTTVGYGIGKSDKRRAKEESAGVVEKSDAARCHTQQFHATKEAEARPDAAAEGAIQ